MFDGKVPHWHHFSCFWLRAAAQSTADIAGFSDLRWEDQEKVTKAIETGGAAGGQTSTFDLTRCHISVQSVSQIRVPHPNPASNKPVVHCWPAVAQVMKIKNRYTFVK